MALVITKRRERETSKSRQILKDLDLATTNTHSHSPLFTTIPDTSTQHEQTRTITAHISTITMYTSNITKIRAA
jgi:hypothetical protein